MPTTTMVSQSPPKDPVPLTEGTYLWPLAPLTLRGNRK